MRYRPSTTDKFRVEWDENLFVFQRAPILFSPKEVRHISQGLRESTFLWYNRLGKEDKLCLNIVNDVIYDIYITNESMPGYKCFTGYEGFLYSIIAQIIEVLFDD